MGIKFFKKSVYDLSNTLPVTTITDAVATDTGEDYTYLMRNRDDSSGWATTDSTDAANTTIEIDFIDVKEFSSALVLNHNLKSYTIQYWDGAMWVSFSTPINVSANTATSNYHTFDSVITQKIKMIITGTQIVDDDKSIRQLLFCEYVGEFSVEPRIKPTIDRDRITSKYLSGKSYVTKSKGGFQCELKLDSVSTEADLALAESIYDSFNGVLMWLSGGTTTQYETLRQGYRLNDIYLVMASNEYQPEWYGGFYRNGMKIDLKLVEIN